MYPTVVLEVAGGGEGFVAALLWAAIGLLTRVTALVNRQALRRIETLLTTSYGTLVRALSAEINILYNWYFLQAFNFRNFHSLHDAPK